MIRSILASLLTLFVLIPAAHAQEQDGLLPVEQAFALKAEITEPGRIALHWQIAPDYYLYKGRISAKTKQAGLQLGDLELPKGIEKHDEFFGDVETYHDAVEASLPYTLGNTDAGTVEVTLTVQGCHETDPKICYPPHPTRLTLALPGAIATPPSALAARLAGGASLGSALDPLDEDEALPPEQAFVYEAIAMSPTEILARWTMPKGYYLYRDRSSVRVADASDVEVGAAQWPAGVDHTDEHFGSVVVYYNQVELPVALKRPSGAAQTIQLLGEFQGCKENGICYPVMQRTVAVDLEAASAEQLAAAAKTFVAATPPATQDSRSDQSEEQVLAANLGKDRLLALLSFFGFGLLLAFTPCVFPMIPILSGIIAGSGENVTTRRAFVLSLVYVLATCVVFTIAGVIAGLAGANLQAAFQQPWILVSFALLFVLLSLSMFGFYELQLPSSWQTKLATISNKQKSGSLAGVAVMGMLSALIVGPCVAPPLAAAVLYISQQRDPVFGGLALFVLSLGMGAPLIVFGTAAGKLLPRAGAWMDAVKAVFGVLFLGLAIWMLSRILDGVWIMLMSGVVLVASAVYLGALDRLADSASGWRKLWKACGVVLLIAGAVQLIGAATGTGDVTRPLAGFGGGGSGAHSEELAFRTIKSSADLDRELAAASAAGKPVMLDFYADWCVSCKEMEKFTFTRPGVHEALGNFVLLKVDVTANDETDQAMLRRFELFGPPATLFFTGSQEQRGLRLIGFENAEAFIARIARVNLP